MNIDIREIYHILCFSQTDSMDNGLESSSMSGNSSKLMLGDEIVERMEETENKDGKRCKPGQIHCSPGLGGGCCPRHHPTCCGNGVHCRKHGPC